MFQYIYVYSNYLCMYFMYVYYCAVQDRGLALKDPALAAALDDAIRHWTAMAAAGDAHPARRRRADDPPRADDTDSHVDDGEQTTRHGPMTRIVTEIAQENM